MFSTILNHEAMVAPVSWNHFSSKTVGLAHEMFLLCLFNYESWNHIPLIIEGVTCDDFSVSACVGFAQPFLLVNHGPAGIHIWLKPN